MDDFSPRADLLTGAVAIGLGVLGGLCLAYGLSQLPVGDENWWTAVLAGEPIGYVAIGAAVILFTLGITKARSV